MKKILTALVMFAFLPLGTPAAAEPMNSTPTPAQLESACGKNGGSYWGTLVTYGCTKKNCDGKGGTCQVICKHGGSCEGSTPKRVRGSAGSAPGSRLSLETILGADKPVENELLDDDVTIAPQRPAPTGKVKGSDVIR